MHLIFAPVSLLLIGRRRLRHICMEKRDLLSYLGVVDSASAVDVAHEFDVSEATAGMALLRLLRQGLVERSIHREMYAYRLSGRGRARLRYFLNLRHT